MDSSAWVQHAVGVCMFTCEARRICFSFNNGDAGRPKDLRHIEVLWLSKAHLHQCAQRLLKLCKVADPVSKPTYNDSQVLTLTITSGFAVYCDSSNDHVTALLLSTEAPVYAHAPDKSTQCVNMLPFKTGSHLGLEQHFQFGVPDL